MKKKVTQRSVASDALPRVYVVQEPKPDPKKNNWAPDFSTAVKYGALRFVYEQGYRGQSDPVAARDKLPDALGEFDPDIDHLLPLMVGGVDPANVWVVLLWIGPLLKKEGYTFINFLYWDRGKGENGYTNENGYYKPCRIPL
jgi:hypothetical protein